jgi:hypothetical protein
MLLNTVPAKAVAYFQSVFAQVSSMDSYLQLAIIEMIHKDCRNATADKVKPFLSPHSMVFFARHTNSIRTGEIHPVHFHAFTIIFSLGQI